MRFGEIMLKNRALLLLLAAVISTAVIGIYLFLVSGDKKAVMATTDKYIQAVMNRDFDAVYDLNAASRKQVAFILKGHGADKEELLKRAYNEQKALFDSAEEAFNSKAAWAEKSTLFQGMSYRILNVTMERDIDNPSAFFRKRVNAIVEVEVEYRKKGPWTASGCQFPSPLSGQDPQEPMIKPTMPATIRKM